MSDVFFSIWGGGRIHLKKMICLFSKGVIFSTSSSISCDIITLPPTLEYKNISGHIPGPSLRGAKWMGVGVPLNNSLGFLHTAPTGGCWLGIRGWEEQ